jgi:RNA polymerase sigma-70 factor (ECF subfamily)
VSRSDQEIVRSCLQGNESAWKDLVRTYERRIYNLTYRFTRCREDAEDLTQDVFIRVHQTMNSYRREAGSLSGWLMRVARNLVIDHYRKTCRRARPDPFPETWLSISNPQTPSPLQCLAQEETAAMLRAALQKLAPGDREVIVLHDLKGLLLGEVAAVLHIPEGTVKSRMVRARRKLAGILANPTKSPCRGSGAQSGNRLQIVATT